MSVRSALQAPNAFGLTLGTAERGAAGLYSDRLIPPAQTVAKMRPFMREFGVTRLARVTGLDFVGIPVWAAIRPNAKTLAQAQGKGIDDDAAQASALMEAIEVACAERTDFETVRACPSELVRFGAAYDRLDGLLRSGSEPIGDDETIEWIEGFDLLRDRPMLVPLEAATLRDAEHRPRYWQTTDGLASGNVLWEAALHGLCERIERDAIAMWLFRSDAEIAARCVDTRSFADAVLTDLRRKIERAGLRLRLFDASCDSAAPVFCAFIAPNDVKRAEQWKHFDLSSGWGCHPTPLRAAIRAVTEAAQTRVTTISAARDDFEPERYDQGIDPSLLLYARARPLPRRDLAEPPPLARADYVSTLLDQLRMIGVKSVILIPLERGQRGFAVARTFVPDLENLPGDRRVRYGPRALRFRDGLQ
jgi:YcaO-like protein with predicted kinase domain